MATWAGHPESEAWLAYQGLVAGLLVQLREPTEAMLYADGGEDAIDCWRAMVEAALAEPDQTKPE